MVVSDHDRPVQCNQKLYLERQEVCVNKNNLERPLTPFEAGGSWLFPSDHGKPE
ncbi:hypothetical protein ACFQY3_02830 [Paenibacillus farraposensis]|uniref:hypothetical protein n=1 Tax=Paenibacillus farraposensis TaxID=2807095 RepID=UPI001E4D4CC8|nr:hypothetical protein [Paenibacillus farraposensis]